MTRPADPWASPAVLRPHRIAREGLDGEAVRRGARVLLDAVEDARRGADLGPMRDAAAALGLPIHRWSDRTRPMPPCAPPSTDLLVWIATDMAPEIGNEAAERHYGPWADTLDPRLPDHRAAIRVAIASACLLPDEDRGVPGERWVDEGPPRPDREAVTAARRLPLVLWRLVEEVEAGCWRVEDVLGLAPWVRPSGPVRLVGPPGRVAGDGPGLLARVGEGPDGPFALTPMIVPEIPPPEALARWFEIELVAGRLRRRGLGQEALLLDEGDTFARRVHEWGWRVQHS